MTESGLNDGDRERIAEFLSKPPYKRDIADLVPQDDPDERASASDGEDGDSDSATESDATNPTELTDADASETAGD